MKKYVILTIIALFVLAACAQPSKPAPSITEEYNAQEPAPAKTVPPVQTQTPPAPEPIVQQETGRTPPTRPLPSERQDTSSAPAVVQDKTEMNPQLRDLLKRSHEKVQSISYLYGGSETGNLFLDTYHVKGDKTKVKKFSEDYYVREGYYDTIYLDLGVACCEELDRCRSHNVDNTKTKYDVDASTLFVPKTPFDWVKEIPADAQVVGPQTFNSRSVTFVKYTDANGAPVQMLIDDTYGVPHRVIVTDVNGNDIKYQFNDMKFNNLKDADFDAPCD